MKRKLITHPDELVRQGIGITTTPKLEEALKKLYDTGLYGDCGIEGVALRLVEEGLRRLESK